ncbi:peptidase [Arthrobacter phage SilentRX]|uniref:lysozyme n=1 Tax=Arthrobacter phage SilentRX TaxID=2836091 RepID=A0A8F3ECN3_9CAUD|nr:peptidase [Arthrobacter phage SilentRX]QWY82766.1 endolysin [Arthrobacter phage SilentRX]
MTTYLNPEEPQWPTTQGFGMFPGGFNPVGGHTGRDKGTPTGRPLRAPADGVIKLAGNAGPWNTNPYWLEGSFAGLSVVLDTGAFAFTFNHLSKIMVTVGQKVKQGDVLALSGNSGGATSGSHHHFECMPDGWNFNNGTYGRINPDTVCKGYFNAPASVPLLPNQRLNGPQITRQRKEASTGSAIIREIPASQLEVWEGFVHGQKVTVNGFTSDVWFKDKVGYAWCGGFTSQSTAGLPDLTPRKALAANQRLTGPAGANQRKEAKTKAAVVREIPGNSVEIFTGFVRGEKVTVNGLTSDLWYVDAKGFAWAGGFTTQSVVGLPDLTVVAPPKPVPPAPAVPAFAYLNGIDVSTYQEAAALNTLSSDFYWIKASEGGGDFSDKDLASNVAEARLAGKPVGFYHFARPLVTAENTAAEEARSFLAVIRPHLQLGDVVALDWEAENQHRTDWALEWLTLVESAVGATPLIYLNAAAINGGDWAKVEAKYPLWYAGYGENLPVNGFVPPRTKPDVTWAAGVAAWQYTSKGRLSGYGGDLDLNIFYGTLEELRALGATRLLADPVPNPPVVTPDPPVADTDKDSNLEEFSQWVGSWLVENFNNRKK